MKPLRIYLAGPMRKFADADYNFPAFMTAAALLRMRGHYVVNPAELDLEDGKATWSPAEGRINLSRDFTEEDALRRDAQRALEAQCNAIVLLPEWEDSVGANKELTMMRDVFRWAAYIYEGDGEIRQLEPQSV